MATRITRKTARAEQPKEDEVKLEQTAPEQAKAEAKPGIPEGFAERSKERSAQNLKLLASCGAFTSSELSALKKAMVEAYEKVSRTTAPVINLTPEALLSFLKDGEYKPFGESGQTSGTPDFEMRAEYSKRTYGYEDPKGCEKYGTIPVEEVNPASPLHKVPLSERFQARYGKVVLRLKPEVGARTTINLLDSAHQWGLDGTWKLKGFGQLFPVPYRTDSAEDFVGCLMAPPTPNSLENLTDQESLWHDYVKGCVRDRNFKLLAIMEGKDGHKYVEAHVHGRISLEDVKEVVSEELPDELKKLAESKGIKVVDAE